MPHLGDGHFAHDARKVPVAGILEACVEIHILESGGDFAPDGIVQQVDTYLILVLFVVVDLAGFCTVVSINEKVLPS